MQLSSFHVHAHPRASYPYNPCYSNPPSCHVCLLVEVVFSYFRQTDRIQLLAFDLSNERSVVHLEEGNVFPGRVGQSVVGVDDDLGDLQLDLGLVMASEVVLAAGDAVVFRTLL